MRPAQILLLLIALAAGGLAAFLATRNSGPATVIEQVAAPLQQTSSKVLVAKAPIGVGQRLNASLVEWQPWPGDAIRPEYITIAQTPNAPDKITGAVARFEIFQGEPILDAKLVHSDQGFLSAVLDPGMRGVSVPVTAASGSGGFIIPNDRVDVLVTSTAQSQTTSRVLLNDVKVLAIGTRLGQSGTTGAPNGDPADPKSQIFTADSIATLELSPPQAETLINATATGKISLVLRSVADFAQTGPTATAQAQTDNNQAVKVIRFGRELSIMSGSDTAPQPTVNPAAFVPPAVPLATTPVAGAMPATTTPAASTPVTTSVTPGTTTTTPDGTVIVTSPTTTTVTTNTPPGAVSVLPAGPTPTTPVQ
jgi:pilus assembly protein CpaB